MTTNKENEFSVCGKKVWAIYIVAVVCLILYLVAVVAQDNEEMFFYGLMAAAAAYVFRPNDELIEGAVKRLFGVDPPKSNEEDE
jgi:phosphatidylserine synthase